MADSTVPFQNPTAQQLLPDSNRLPIDNVAQRRRMVASWQNRYIDTTTQELKNHLVKPSTQPQFFAKLAQLRRTLGTSDTQMPTLFRGIGDTASVEAAGTEITAFDRARAFAELAAVEIAAFKHGETVRVLYGHSYHPASYVKRHIDGSHEVRWHEGNYANHIAAPHEVQHGNSTTPPHDDAHKHPFPASHEAHILGRHLSQHYGAPRIGVTDKPLSDWKFHTHRISEDGLNSLEHNIKHSPSFRHVETEEHENHTVSTHHNRQGGGYQLWRSKKPGIDHFAIAKGAKVKPDVATASISAGKRIKVFWGDAHYPATYVKRHADGRHEVKWDEPGHANPRVRDSAIHNFESHNAPATKVRGGDDRLKLSSDTTEMSRELNKHFGTRKLKTDRYAPNRIHHSIDAAGLKKIKLHLARTGWRHNGPHEVGEHSVDQYHNGHGGMLNVMRHNSGKAHGITAISLKSHVASDEHADAAFHRPPPTVMKKMRGSGNTDTYEVTHNRQMIGTVHRDGERWHAMHNGHSAGTHADLKGAGRVLRNLHMRKGLNVPVAATVEGAAEEHAPKEDVHAWHSGAWHPAKYVRKNDNGTHHVAWTGEWKGYHEDVDKVRKPPVAAPKTTPKPAARVKPYELHKVANPTMRHVTALDGNHLGFTQHNKLAKSYGAHAPETKGVRQGAHVHLSSHSSHDEAAQALVDHHIVRDAPKHDETPVKSEPTDKMPANTTLHESTTGKHAPVGAMLVKHNGEHIGHIDKTETSLGNIYRAFNKKGDRVQDSGRGTFNRVHHAVHALVNHHK